MESTQRKGDEDVTVVSHPERILRDSRRSTITSSAATPVGNMPIATQSLEAALKKAVTAVRTAEGEVRFDGPVDRPVLIEHFLSKMGPAYFCSKAWPWDIVRG